MATINLAPGSQYIAALRRRRRILFTLSSSIIVVLVVIGAGLAVLKQSATQKLAKVETELRSAETQIAQLADDVKRINLFEQRLASLDSLLANHLTWTPLLKDMERLLPAPIVLSQISANSTDTLLTVNGVTANIDDVAQTLASFSTSAGRPTLFKTADLKTINRKDVTGPDGQVQGSQYVFTARFLFDHSALTSSSSK